MTMSTTYATFVPAIPDVDHELFLMAVRPTTEAAKAFCATVKRHLAGRGLGADFYEMYIFNEGTRPAKAPATSGCAPGSGTRRVSPRDACRDKARAPKICL